ncbi:hypothetical protein MCOR02_010636 [Pyricularia oryzae]|nr:hypothetical protein MCOR02_010636 [Pyricularia oryzae]KAI6337710.1 hypothetical protein MCOR30_003297 [Pyricularia oryzae]KAI6373506.1 hypothetical protein MCOR31_003169 [Pyricularia oryzae]KAI6436493.1 hypothetical protein MCOR21_001080 [Pyricularia oryzae]KAI6504778.1 hypothetical protein MCOR13_004703 [Pyricularia oryzae]
MSAGWGGGLRFGEKQNECEELSRQILENERLPGCIPMGPRKKLARIDWIGSNLGRNAKLTGWVGIPGWNGDGSLEKLSLRTPRHPGQFGWLMAPANLAQPSPGAAQLMMSSDLAVEDRTGTAPFKHNTDFHSQPAKLSS